VQDELLTSASDSEGGPSGLSAILKAIHPRPDVICTSGTPSGTWFKWARDHFPLMQM
jgi:hypothetical protein